ncbi:hypothetical protein DL764_008244 [Monosporascus ibericus]|uniref:Major facilitator superfamily (MFS) profile domain-containing protein n=1 Tax=Monosporascus ibericus TaxID=155417 RepID=A0A4Q4T0T2_9PEZI|nr:hypothetical protein DL764_008244 [Monosporascus ibericus]
MTLPNQCRGDSRNGMAEPGSGHVEDAKAPSDIMDPDTEAIERASHEVEREGTSTKETTDIRPSGELRRTASNVLFQVTSRMTTRSLPEPLPPPDGGVKAWTQVAMAWLVMIYYLGVFQTYYTTTMSQPPSTISWIGSLQTWLTLLIGAFSGRLLDAGLFMPTFLVGSVLQVLGMFLMSISTEYWHLVLTQGVLTGIGGGIFFTPSLALISTYFQSKRGLAVGIATTGNSAGGMIYPLVVRQLIPQVGFAWTVRVLAFINLSCLATALAFMRPRLRPRKSGPIIELAAFREPVYVAFVSGLFVSMLGNYYTFYYIASFGTQALGLSYSSASILIMVLNGVALPFRVIPAFIADRIGVLNVIVPLTYAWCIVAFCWLAVTNTTGYYIFTCFYGIISGSFQSLIATTIANITKRLDMVGTRLGMAFSIVSFASLTGPPIGGALQGANGGRFVAPQAWAAGMTAIAMVLVTLARVSRGGYNLKVKC